MPDVLDTMTEEGGAAAPARRPIPGQQAAAILMLLFSEEQAAEILARLEPEEVRQLSEMMYTVAEARLERHLRFKLPFTPTSASWLNLIEPSFSRDHGKAHPLRKLFQRQSTGGRHLRLPLPAHPLHLERRHHRPRPSYPQRAQ